MIKVEDPEIFFKNPAAEIFENTNITICIGFLDFPFLHTKYETFNAWFQKQVRQATCLILHVTTDRTPFCKY